MKYSASFSLITSLLLLSSCNETFDEDPDIAKEELKMLLGENPELNNSISLIENQGFECTNQLTSWAIEYLPDEISSEPSPYFCSLTKSTVPFVCSEYWTIYLGHNNEAVLSTYISKSEQSCL